MAMNLKAADAERLIYQKLNAAICVAGVTVNKKCLPYDHPKRKSLINALIVVDELFKNNPDVAAAFYNELMARFRQAALESLFDAGET